MANGGGPHGHDAVKAKTQTKTKGKQPVVKAAKTAAGKPGAKKKD